MRIHILQASLLFPLRVFNTVLNKTMNWFNEAAPEILDEGSATASHSTMKAASYRTHGGENVIEITDRMKRPVLKDNQVLVKVYTSGVNPVDVKLRENSLPTMVRPLPKIIGSDVYGVILDRGKKASEKFLIGDKVIAMMPHVFSGWGSAAEFAAIDDAFLAHAPSNVSAAEAGSLPLIGLTVLQAFAPFIAHCKGQTAGRSVLIQAGAGGLGTFAIQYCKHELEMTVYATCSAGNVAFLQSLGADVVIDYAAQRFEEAAQGMDVVFDPMAYLYEDRTFRSAVLKNKDSFYLNIPSSFNALDAAYADPLGLAIPEAAPHKIALGWGAVLVRGFLAKLGFPVAQYVFHFVHPDGKTLAEVARLVQERVVRPVVEAGSVYPLEQTAEAHRRVREGHVRGKVVLQVAQEPSS